MADADHALDPILWLVILQLQDGPHNLIKFKITEPTPPWQAKSNRPNRQAQKQKTPLKNQMTAKICPKTGLKQLYFVGRGSFVTGMLHCAGLRLCKTQFKESCDHGP
jgi:hypothetical protein